MTTEYKDAGAVRAWIFDVDSNHMKLPWLYFRGAYMFKFADQQLRSLAGWRMKAQQQRATAR